VRLDRALATADWSTRFPLATVHHLTAVKSDHSPILLLNEMEAHNRRIGNDKLFRYELMWERHEEFQPMLTSAWSTEGRARSVGELNDKLRNTAGSILGWCSQSFGAVRTELRKMRSQLQALGMKPSRVWPRTMKKRRLNKKSLN
jgi:hypothetical protein